MKLTEDDFECRIDNGDEIYELIAELTKEGRDEIILNQKIVEELQFRKKHPMAMNYATFESWVTDLLEGKIEAN